MRNIQLDMILLDTLIAKAHTLVKRKYHEQVYGLHLTAFIISQHAQTPYMHLTIAEQKTEPIRVNL